MVSQISERSEKGTVFAALLFGFAALAFVYWPVGDIWLVAMLSFIGGLIVMFSDLRLQYWFFFSFGAAVGPVAAYNYILITVDEPQQFQISPEVEKLLEDLENSSEEDLHHDFVQRCLSDEIVKASACVAAN